MMATAEASIDTTETLEKRTWIRVLYWATIPLMLAAIVLTIVMSQALDAEALSSTGSLVVLGLLLGTPAFAAFAIIIGIVIARFGPESMQTEIPSGFSIFMLAALVAFIILIIIHVTQVLPVVTDTA